MSHTNWFPLKEHIYPMGLVRRRKNDTSENQYSPYYSAHRQSYFFDLILACFLYAIEPYLSCSVTFFTVFFVNINLSADMTGFFTLWEIETSPSSNFSSLFQRIAYSDRWCWVWNLWILHWRFGEWIFSRGLLTGCAVALSYLYSYARTIFPVFLNFWNRFLIRVIIATDRCSHVFFWL